MEANCWCCGTGNNPAPWFVVVAVAAGANPKAVPPLLMALFVATAAASATIVDPGPNWKALLVVGVVAGTRTAAD